MVCLGVFEHGPSCSWQECEVVGHIASVLRKQRQMMDAGAQLHCSLLFSVEPWPRDGATLI